ncbi:P-II family nitrogen regulator [Paraferrimonas sedimenticola]|uniref:Nitrogen regulatory protein P-II n=1 Tax=Paraferrimonas sedimenticola TaxID=375674 RepID=A0AA37VT60_9GAMM|nr:P-II family nitrogen regulator [Paraferrimonas sedimenticola]GLP95081.1 nitrogen regulatory protein P-II [Paraferrimonas sedimenticola]
MRFKLILAFVEEADTEAVIDATRKAGATGATVINHARGEGITPHKSFFGLELDLARDVILFVVEEHLARGILEVIEQTGGFETGSGKGIAIQIGVEDAVGVSHQVASLRKSIEEQL